MTEKKFEWKPTECAPIHYASEIYQGSFITDDDKYITIPYGGTIKQGWGHSGSSWAVGEDLKPVPSHLKIIWISYTENQFYYLDTKLPKQKMIELFEKGFIDKQGKQSTYDDIVVGLAPGGAVSVWLLEATRTTEIGHYQAKKTEVDMKIFNPDGIQNRDEYVRVTTESFSEETKKVLAEQGIPIGKWTAFRQRFLWKPVIKHVEELKLVDLSIDFYNGERYSVRADNPILDDYQNYPPTSEIGFYWYDKRDNQFGSIITFNEKEIWAAFKKIYKNKETKQAALVFTIDKYNSNVAIFLKSELDSIKIEKATVKTYMTSD
ncbi:MAG: DUF2931 family protein [Flavobacteriaceae bacterium]|nr:DUF2931 family protein [Flavobacteriaceae bacterium]